MSAPACVTGFKFAVCACGASMYNAEDMTGHITEKSNQQAHRWVYVPDVILHTQPLKRST